MSAEGKYNKNGKLLTVSIAAYNVEAYLTETLESLAVPEILDELEVLVIDDGELGVVRVAAGGRALHGAQDAVDDGGVDVLVAVAPARAAVGYDAFQVLVGLGRRGRKRALRHLPEYRDRACRADG